MSLANLQKLLDAVGAMKACPETFEVEENPIDIGYIIIADGKLLPFYAASRDDAEKAVELVKKLIASR